MKKKEIEKGRHSRTLLPGISLLYVVSQIGKILHLIKDKKAGDPRVLRTATSGMTASFGFTLIELLVVVLIIGILAAVALPQYQKAVWKSRNTQLKILTKSVWDAEVAYFLANNEYATRFDELDINLPLEAPTVSVGSVAPCEIRVASTDSVRQGNNYQIILNATSSSNVSITALYTDGPYKCQGFSLSSSHGFTCREKPMENFSFGNFCPKLENATVIVGGGGSTASWANYQMP